MQKLSKNTELTKKLRELTGAGITDCKQALEDNNWNLESAKTSLKKQGLLVGVLRGAKDTSQGVVTATTTKDTPNETPGHFGTITCLSCETESVAKLANFIEVATEIALYTVEHEETTLEELQEEFKENITELMSTIKENINLSHYSFMDGEHIAIYNHQTNKLSVLVKFNKEYDEKVGKNVAMQIASMRPLFVDYDDIPKSIINAELTLALEMTRKDTKNEGKAEELIEKIAEGRLKKQKDKMTLLNQLYTQRDKEENKNQTVRQYLESVDKDLKVITFRPFEIG